MNEDAALQERLRQDDKKALEVVYLKNRSYVMGYFRKYRSINSQLEDIYQDSIIDLYQNFVTRQLFLDKGNIRAYLLAIVKKKISKALKDKNQAGNLDAASAYDTKYHLLETETTSREQELLTSHYQKLGKKCQQLLKLFYYRGLSIKEIRTQANYKDDNTVKSSKSRCLKQLKALISQSQNGAR